ncbi:MAG TPA: hypothetical protein VM509_05185 [Planctomycetota bacterium]|nr:hypothetical protein [Planctomycetota bacterium]
MSGSRLIFALLCACAAASCTTTHELSTVNAETAIVQRLDPEKAWRVLDGGNLRGFVVCFADPKRPGRRTYSVRNELHQELGTIDELGRAWRFVPHQREAQWVCTSTLVHGATALLEAGSGALLEEVALDVLRAAPATAH